MAKKSRRLLFYVLVFLFTVLVPILIAYSFGLRLNFDKGVLESTGGIFVKSKTPHLSLFLNNNFVKKTSLFPGGALLPEIAPGAYLMRIEKEGYHPWSKVVKVEPALVTELRNIILISEPLSISTTTKPDTRASNESAGKSAFSKDKKNNLRQKTATSSEIVATNILTFHVADDSVLFIDKNGFLAELDPSSRNISTIGRPGFFLDKEPVRFFRSPRGDTLILDSAGGAFLLDTSKNLSPVSGGVKNVAFDQNGDKALLRKENEIDVLWLADNRYQPFEKRGALETIIKVETSTDDAGWFYGDNAHIILRTADGVFLTELDGRGGRNTVEIVSWKTDEILTSPEIPYTMFFRKGKVWQKIEL